MKRIVIILFLISCSLLEIAKAANTNNNQLYQVFNDKKSNGDYNMMVKEVERTEDTSVLVYEQGKNAPHIPPMISSMFIMCACYDIAKERGFEHFVNLSKNPGDIAIGFSNQSTADTINHFQKYNDKLTANDIVSVSQFSIICDAPTPYVTKEHYTPHLGP